MCAERTYRVVYLVWVLRLQYGFLSSRHGCKQHEITIGVDGDSQRCGPCSCSGRRPCVFSMRSQAPCESCAVSLRRFARKSPALVHGAISPRLLFLFHGPLCCRRLAGWNRSTNACFLLDSVVLEPLLWRRAR